MATIVKIFQGQSAERGNCTHIGSRAERLSCIQENQVCTLCTSKFLLARTISRRVLPCSADWSKEWTTRMESLTCATGAISGPQAFWPNFAPVNDLYTRLESLKTAQGIFKRG